AKKKGIHRNTVRSHPFYFLPSAIIQGLTRTDRCTHGFLAGTGAVVTHIAFHHQFCLFILFWNSKRAGQNAVGTTDTPRGVCRMYHPKIILVDGIRRTYVGTGGILAMHADLNRGLSTYGTIYIMDMDHAFLSVCFAFRTSHFAGMAADTTLHVH